MKGRFEYRVFGKDLSEEKEYLKKYYKSMGEKETKEEYLLSKDVCKYNIKIKDKKLDVKILHSSVDGFEQWDVLYKEEFPIQGAYLNSLFKKENFPSLSIKESELKEVINAKENLKMLPLSKNRVFFEKEKIQAEFASLKVQNKIFHTIALESTDLENLKKETKKLGLQNCKNINYYKFLQSLIWSEW